MENKRLQLKRKQNTPFISDTGSLHNDAVLIVSSIDNQIIDKRLNIRFIAFNSINDLAKKPIDPGFVLAFDMIDTSDTIIHPDTKEVVKWGKPSYTDVLALFNIVDNGIILTSEQAESWLLNGVEFKNEALNKEWELMF